MLKKQSATFCFAAVLAICALTAMADTVVNDDLVVQGSQCVGVDCVNDEIFDNDTLKLKENNLRVRFHDTSAPDVLGQSWNLSANNSRNGGKSYFSFEMKSLTEDTILLSDGTAPLYDCTQTDPNTMFPPVVGTIPEGDPVIAPVSAVGDGSWNCDTVAAFTEKPAMLLGTTADNNVTLGYDSRAETDAISIGAVGLLRKLEHVAAGIADTDVLLIQALNSYIPFQDQETQLASLQQQVSDLEMQITEIEDKVFNNHAPTAPVLLSPADNETVPSSPVILSWRRSTDSEGDAIRYRVSVCKQADFGGCTPVDVAGLDQTTVLAGFGGGAGMLLLAGLVMPRRRHRRQRWLHKACVIATVTGITASSGCFHDDDDDDNNSDSGSGEITYAASGLDSGATYFWKVTATDFIDTSESEVRSFHIQ